MTMLAMRLFGVVMSALARAIDLIVFICAQK